MNVSLEKLRQCESRYYRQVNSDIPAYVSIEDMPDEELVGEPKARGGIDTVEGPIEERMEMLKAEGLEPLDFAIERAVGKNDSVYSNFIELIAAAKKKVGRIEVKEGIQNKGFATGFMVSERLLLTNWHVFKTKAAVADSEIQFFFELDVFGRPGQPVIFKFAPDKFFHADRKLDYCFVAVQTLDITGQIPLFEIGYHFLNPATGKVVHEGTELLNIIHHPEGDYKQLSIRENELVKVLPFTLWYKSDTAPGSSGGPVFNDQWQVVALHHMGIPKRSEDGQHFLDRKGNAIEPIDGQIDIAKIHWVANEGIRISKILKDIFVKFPANDFVSGLKIEPKPVAQKQTRGALQAMKAAPKRESSNPMPMASPPPSPVPQRIDKQPQTDQSQEVKISFPASMVKDTGHVTIRIDTTATVTHFQKQPDHFPSTDLIGGFEIKRLEKEVDYDACHGYQSNFLCVHLPIPEPKGALKNDVAILLDGETTILNYHHFSVIQHADRKMPIISAINIDGNPEKRQDHSKRKDVWLRDTRLDFDLQLNDRFYRKSGFDRGHMSRREDANWGDTPALAKRNADLTCVYTNACPQAPKLNRSNKGGIWGKLEMLILEKGIDKETGRSSKISVFNGPVFSPSDRLLKGVQIPMEFWKIILWYNEKEALKATGFKLSQVGLVEHVNFDEALDFDKNMDFQPFQVSIQTLEELTSLDFSTLIPYDTFNEATGEVPVNTEEELLELLG